MSPHLNGNTVTISAQQSGFKKDRLIDFPGQILSFSTFGAEFVIEYMVSNGGFRAERYDKTGFPVWSFESRDAHKVSVTQDALEIDAVRYELLQPLVAACEVAPSGYAILTSPTVAENLYCYAYDGSLRWQVAKRDFTPEVPYEFISILNSNIIRARIRHGARIYDVSVSNGQILSYKDSKQAYMLQRDGGQSIVGGKTALASIANGKVYASLHTMLTITADLRLENGAN